MPSNQSNYTAESLIIEANCQAMDTDSSGRYGSPELAAAMLRAGADAMKEVARLHTEIKRIDQMFSSSNKVAEIERLARSLEPQPATVSA